MEKKTMDESNSPDYKPPFSIKTILKIIISLILITGLVSRIDISESVQVLKQIDLSLYFLALFLGFNSTLIVSYRCKYVCKKKIGVSIPLSKCYQYYFYSSFYSNFLPTAIGGDIFRIYHLNRHIMNISDSSSVVLFERISGFFSLLVISFVASIVLFFNFNQHEFLPQTILIAFVFIFCLLLVLSRNFESLLGKIAVKVGLSTIFDYIKRITNNIKLFINDYSTAKYIFFQSLSYQLFSVIIAFIYGSSLGIDVPVIFYFVMVPITYFVTMIPISFAGIGLREVTIVSLFSLVGVQSHVAITLSFLLYLEILFKGLVGGIFLFIVSIQRS